MHPDLYIILHCMQLLSDEHDAGQRLIHDEAY